MADGNCDLKVTGNEGSHFLVTSHPETVQSVPVYHDDSRTNSLESLQHTDKTVEFSHSLFRHSVATSYFYGNKRGIALNAIWISKPRKNALRYITIWIPGVITKTLSPRNFEVQVGDVIWKRHQDQIRPRHIPLKEPHPPGHGRETGPPRISGTGVSQPPENRQTQSQQVPRNAVRHTAPDRESRETDLTMVTANPETVNPEDNCRDCELEQLDKRNNIETGQSAAVTGYRENQTHLRRSERRNRHTDRQMLRMLLESFESSTSSLSIETIHIDQEAAMAEAVRNTSNFVIKFCHFHIRQSWLRKMQTLGLITDYKNEESDIGNWLKLFFGLPALSHEEVDDVFAFCLMVKQP
ncbi:hypothetical protein RRG08_044871 [Elysia crispata]|uniref:MULE transposase domain-containing protein n=1 Tax=Elysia crispata TaxID=231223 RepID=A0AAE0XE96_9GAST|nr:hypothetical protein RRG08_044871 [Elysia crispata]